MKHTYFNLKTILFCLCVTTFMATTSTTVIARGKKDHSISTISSQPAVTYVKTDATGSTFKVTFDTESKAKFELSVLDVNGNVLFKGIYDSDNFSKNIRLLDEGYDVTNLSFSIRVIPTGQVHNFKVSTNTVIIKDVIVKKQ